MSRWNPSIARGGQRTSNWNWKSYKFNQSESLQRESRPAGLLKFRYSRSRFWEMRNYFVACIQIKLNTVVVLVARKYSQLCRKCIHRRIRIAANWFGAPGTVRLKFLLLAIARQSKEGRSIKLSNRVYTFKYLVSEMRIYKLQIVLFNCSCLGFTVATSRPTRGRDEITWLDSALLLPWDYLKGFSSNPQSNWEDGKGPRNSLS